MHRTYDDGANTRIPLALYQARNVTSRRWRESGLDHPLAQAPVFLLGDSAIGSPSFQWISLDLEDAVFLAALLCDRDLPMTTVFERYEAFMYRQWLRVSMGTQLIKHDKDRLESVDDTWALLEKRRVFERRPAADAPTGRADKGNGV